MLWLDFWGKGTVTKSWPPTPYGMERRQQSKQQPLEDEEKAAGVWEAVATRGKQHGEYPKGKLERTPSMKVFQTKYESVFKTLRNCDMVCFHCQKKH